MSEKITRKGCKMDDIDLKLLNSLQLDGRSSIKKLAEQCFVSSPAASARIQNLEKENYIKEYQAILNYKKLGFHIKAYVSLEVSPKDKPEFYPFIESIPNVLECDCVTGPFSMLLKVVFPGTDELDQFIGLLQRFGNTNTQIVFSTPVGPRGLIQKEFKSK
jgi:Lrp/AsnC family leucine-responsive transcriptional regulator